MRSGITALSLALAVFLLRGPALAAIVDRIVITVDQKVITAAELEEELRVTAFIERQQLDLSLEKRRQAADRLVEQVLVRREMELNRYPVPTDAESAAYLAQLVKEYGGEESFKDALARNFVDERVLRHHLAFQITMLRFLDYRFRPDIDVTDQEIQTAYDKEVAVWRQKNTGQPPSLDDNRESLKKKIFEDHVENEFSSWLEETRKQVKVNYVERDLQ